MESFVVLGNSAQEAIVSSRQRSPCARRADFATRSGAKTVVSVGRALRIGRFKLISSNAFCVGEVTHVS